MKIVYIIGKSCVGKDTIYKLLKDKIDVMPYVLYTTRPIRTGEENGVDYHFLNNNEMTQYINEQSKMIEYRTYNTVHGPWTYATILDEQFLLKKDLLMEGTLESYNAVKDYFENNKDIEVVPIYVEIDDGIRLERALKREKEQKQPKYEELCRRFLADSKDFSEENILKSGIVKRFINIDINICLKEIINYIKKYEKTSF